MIQAGKSSYTEKDKQALAEEVLDPNRIILVCERHNYQGPPKPPVFECKDCVQVYMVSLYANTPPHERKEQLENLERFIRDSVQADEKNQFDITLSSYPTIEYSK